jgi:hypothetical protein
MRMMSAMAMLTKTDMPPVNNDYWEIADNI